VDFQLSDDQQTIRTAVAELAAKFDDHYWMTKDQQHEFPDRVLRRVRRGRLARHHHAGGIWGPRIRHHRGIHPAGGGRRQRRRDERRKLDAHVDIRHASRDRARVRGTQGPHAAPASSPVTCTCVFGVTEPGAGLDTTKITTFARREDDHYVVSGRKVWISKALESEKVLLLTRTMKFEDVTRKTDGLTLFLTDLDRSKVDIRPIPKMGRKRGVLQRVVHRRPRDPHRGPRRRGGPGFPLHPRRAEPRALSQSPPKRWALDAPRCVRRCATATSVLYSAGRSE